MKVRWSEEARQDVRDLFAYIANDDPQAARRLVVRMRKAVCEAARFPRMGRVVPEFDNDEIRELIVPPYRIVFRVGQEPSIARVWHSRRLLSEDSV